MLTAKLAVSRSRGHVVDLRDGLMAIIGGSSESEKND
jgi:hypothetical protein